MKKVVLLLLGLTFMSATTVAQKNIVKAGFVASGGVNSGVQYERSVSNRISISGQLGYATIFDVWSSENTNGLGLYFEGRYYFSGSRDLMEGWHAGIYVNYMDTKNKSDITPFNRDTFSVGVVGGYQWVFNSHVTLDTLIGAGFMNIDEEFSKDNGIYPLLGLNLGYNF